MDAPLQKLPNLRMNDTGTPSPVTLGQASLYWLKLGFISFGGPAGQIAIMHRDLVEQKGWISEKRFLHALNFCMVLPGPEAQQLATYIGWLMHRNWGGIIAGALFVLPSFFLLVALTWIYLAYGHVPAVAGVLYGIKPAIVAVVIYAAYRIGSRTLNNYVLWFISAFAFVALTIFKLPFPFIILTAGLIGYGGGRFLPHRFETGKSHGASREQSRPALIDDTSPIPSHALFSWSAFWRTVATGLVIWLVAIGILSGLYGWNGTFTQMGWFFTKAALLTFGGAYAVLPYVYLGAVEHYQWLTAVQMIDGLALGETTPGPLIMVVTFVGFVGGWVMQVLGPEARFASAFTGAAVATFFTFLPSFIFIFMGAPFIETTHGKLSFTAPLKAITAAVVGVILNLAVFFAYHVVWPQGWAGVADGFSIALIIAAVVMMFRFNAGVIPVLLSCGMLGMVWRLVG
jgi:chromate transporter